MGFFKKGEKVHDGKNNYEIKGYGRRGKVKIKNLRTGKERLEHQDFLRPGRKGK
jgi:hypothetical protein